MRRSVFVIGIGIVIRSMEGHVDKISKGWRKASNNVQSRIILLKARDSAA